MHAQAVQKKYVVKKHAPLWRPRKESFDCTCQRCVAVILEALHDISLWMFYIGVHLQKIIFEIKVHFDFPK